MGAMTKIPTATETVQPVQTILFSVTSETVARFEKYRELRVTDIRDKSQIAAVHTARMELVKTRTAVDKTRKEMNEDHNREIKNNNEKAKALLLLFEPIELHLKREEDAAESALEAERVAKKKAMHDTRKAQMVEAVGEYTEILAMWPADLSDAGAAEFDAMLVMAGVHATGKRQLAEAARIAKEQADAALAEQQERDRLAAVELLKQQAIEDANRKAAQAELDAKMAAFEKQQREAAELQRKADEAREARIAQENADRMEREAVQRAADQAKLDAQNAELERQRAEIETKRMAYEAEMMKLAREADERVRVRLEADAKAKEEERLRIKAENDALTAKAEEAALAIMRPDTELMAAWITAVENFADEQFPSVSQSCEDLLAELHRDLANVFSAMRERLT